MNGDVRIASISTPAAGREGNVYASEVCEERLVLTEALPGRGRVSFRVMNGVVMYDLSVDSPFSNLNIISDSWSGLPFMRSSPCTK